MVHEMNLLRDPFDRIAEGSKTVEMRLYDEKRQRIRVGDEIVFSCADLLNRPLRVRVVSIDVFEDFLALAEAFPSRALGFKGKTAADVAAYMNGIYGEAAIRSCRTVGIGVKLL